MRRPSAGSATGMEARRAETRYPGARCVARQPGPEGGRQNHTPSRVTLATGTTRLGPRPLSRRRPLWWSNQRRIFSKVSKPTRNVSAWAELRTARQSTKARSATLTMFSASIRVNCRPML